LSALIESSTLRTRIGTDARADVLARHTTAARGHQLRTLMDDLVTELAAERA